jgi:hypothetical protein
MTLFSSPARRPRNRFGFAMLTIMVVSAAILYGLFLSQPWPT